MTTPPPGLLDMLARQLLAMREQIDASMMVLRALQVERSGEAERGGSDIKKGEAPAVFGSSSPT